MVRKGAVLTFTPHRVFNSDYLSPPCARMLEETYQINLSLRCKKWCDLSLAIHSADQTQVGHVGVCMS